jgi:hypothetical protein
MFNQDQQDDMDFISELMESPEVVKACIDVYQKAYDDLEETLIYIGVSRVYALKLLSAFKAQMCVTSLTDADLTIEDYMDMADSLEEAKEIVMESLGMEPIEILAQLLSYFEVI